MSKWHLIDGEVEHNGRDAFLTYCGKTMFKSAASGRLDVAQGVGEGLICLTCAVILNPAG